jgi:hypothetical protein
MSTAEDARRAITQLHGMSRWGGNITVKLVSGASDKVLDTITAEAQEPSEDIEEGYSNYDSGIAECARDCAPSSYERGFYSFAKCNWW